MDICKAGKFIGCPYQKWFSKENNEEEACQKCYDRAEKDFQAITKIRSNL